MKREKPRRRGASLFKRKDGYGRAVGYVSCLLGAESEGSRPQHTQQYDQNQRDDLFDIIHFQFPLIRLCGSDDPAFHFAFKSLSSRFQVDYLISAVHLSAHLGGG